LFTLEYLTPISSIPYFKSGRYTSINPSNFFNVSTFSYPLLLYIIGIFNPFSFASFIACSILSAYIVPETKFML